LTVASIFTSASSGGVFALPAMTASRMLPVIFEFLAFASNVPTVKKPDCSRGGLHDGEFSGGPCSLLGDVHLL
jgi:hypothetical protein